jgi:hypothetical protein
MAENALFRGRTAKVIVPAIHAVVKEMDEGGYLPLTVRQIYYQLVAREVIENCLGEYNNISRLLTVMRRNDLLAWEAIEDRSRRMLDKRGVTDLEAHIAEETQRLFRFYNRCLVQNQENYVEIWTEKDALTSIIHDACWIYCTRIVVARGQASASYINKYADRAKAAQHRGQRPVILQIGDHDPTGEKIPYSILHTLKEHHNVDFVHIERVALTVEQIEKYHVPASVEAVKDTDPNYPWFRDQGWNTAAEVDALHPAALKGCIEAALGKYLDVEDMVQQQEIEKRERTTLKKLERMFSQACGELGIRYIGACSHYYE